MKRPDKPGIGLLNVTGSVLAWITSAVLSTAAADTDRHGTLELSVIDETTQLPTATRIELLDKNGKGYVADDALPVGGDCEDRPFPLNATFDPGPEIWLDTGLRCSTTWKPG